MYLWIDRTDNPAYDWFNVTNKSNHDMRNKFAKLRKTDWHKIESIYINEYKDIKIETKTVFIIFEHHRNGCRYYYSHDIVKGFVDSEYKAKAYVLSLNNIRDCDNFRHEKNKRYCYKEYLVEL